MKILRTLFLPFAFAAAVLPITSPVFTAPLYAQSTTGVVFGIVTDATGAAIPGATITLTEVRTGAKQTTTSSGQGEYTFAIVNPGSYKVSTVAPGFKTSTQTGIDLSANQNIKVPFALSTGDVAESVTVEAGVTLVDTREAQIGETIDQNKIENLPTLSRDPYTLVTTTPGVTVFNGDTAIGSRAGVTFSVNGLSSDQVSYYIDGAYDFALGTNGGNKIPNNDALSEFRILTSNFDAEFGRSPSAVINAITRSGTDKFHGAAYDYIQNNILNARGYFVMAPGPNSPTIKLQQNQFGGRIGGPVHFVHDTFFFLDYQGTVLRSQAVVTSNNTQVLTAAERAGDFTQDAAASLATATNPVFGKTGTFQNPGVKLNALKANCGTTTSPVICNGTNYNPMISGANGQQVNFLDPVAQNVLALVPVGAPVGGSGALAIHQINQQTSKADSISNEGTARFDFNRIHNHQIETTLFYTQGTDTNPSAGGNQLLSYAGSLEQEQVFNLVGADVWSINATTVNSFRAFTSRNHYTIFNENNLSAQQLGSTIPAAGSGAASPPPRFLLNGYFDIGGGNHGPANVNSQQFGGVDTINLTRGRHSIKLGGSYVYNRFSNLAALTSAGNFTFNGGTTGNTFADFLIGSASAFNQANVVTHNTYSYDPALYAQDDWQITRKLNLNLGVRWEVFAPYFGDNTFGTFNPGVQSKVVPTAPVGLLYEGDAGIPNGLYSTSYLSFAPRVGFAYDVYGDGKTSLRGGFGLFYFEQSGTNSTGQTNAPFTLSTTINQTANLVCPYGGITTANGGTCPFNTMAGSDPFPYDPSHPTFLSPAGGSNLNSLPPNGGSTPYVYEYNLALEQQLSPKTALHIAYVGNSLRKEYISVDENTPSYVSSSQYTAFASQALYGTPTLPTGKTVPGELSAGGILLRRQYEPYTRITTDTGFRFGAINLNEPSENGQFHSLQVTLRGRPNKRLQAFASYVWSKNLNYAGGTANQLDIRSNYGASDTDLRHRFVVSYLFEFPSTTHLGVVGRELLNGWRINGITGLQSGSPFTVTSGTDTNFDGNNNDRVNVISSQVNRGHLTRAQKIQFGTLNVAALSIPANVSPTDNPYGNEQKNQFYGPANINTNLSLFKEFALYEQARLQFRAEAFNAFGNVNLNNPRTGLTNIQNTGLNQITGAGPARRLQFAAKIIF